MESWYTISWPKRKRDLGEKFVVLIIMYSLFIMPVSAMSLLYYLYNKHLTSCPLKHNTYKTFNYLKTYEYTSPITHHQKILTELTFKNITNSDIWNKAVR